MKEDQQDAATIQSTKAETLSKLIAGGYTPESAVKTVVTDDFSLLEHTGLYSVQLQPPGSGNAEDAVEPGDDLPAPTGSSAVKPAPSGTNGSREFEVTDYMLSRLLLDVEREKGAQPTNIHVTTPPTTVEISDGAFQSHVSLELPPGEGSRTEFAEGAFQTHVSVEPSPTSVSVEPSHVTVEPMSVSVEAARTEIAEGAIQTNVTVEPAEVTVPVTVEPARTEIQEGAIQMTVEPADVTVEIDAPPIEVNIENRAADSPAPIIQVEPTPVTIENQIDVQQPNKTIRFVRDSEGAIVEAESEDADGPGTDGGSG